MITTDRDVFIGAHLTKMQKEQFQIEAARRNKSMSLLLSEILSDWLNTAPNEDIGPVRSRRRRSEEEDEEKEYPKEEDIPLPFEAKQ